MTFRVKLLQPNDSAESFPDPNNARASIGYPDGLIAIGGDLSSERLLYAYSRGIFPWFNDDQPIMWWSPDPRAVIFTADFHMSRSLSRRLRNESWEYSLNQDFAISAYQRMHELGYAHSVEAWCDGELAGGIYGLRIGNIFCGESMFSLHADGSKVALSALVHVCKEEQIELIDCQLESTHLESLGMIEIPRSHFLDLLRGDSAKPAQLLNWEFSRLPATGLTYLRDA
jgi:leucyl/phenylalanyl-tRNA--protein transferase